MFQEGDYSCDTETFNTPSVVSAGGYSNKVSLPLPSMSATSSRSPAGSVSSDSGSTLHEREGREMLSSIQRRKSSSSVPSTRCGMSYNDLRCFLSLDRNHERTTPTPPTRTASISSILSRAGSQGSSGTNSTLVATPTRQSSQSSLFEVVARDAKELAREASKSAMEAGRSALNEAKEASKTALEVTKPARDASKKTLFKALKDQRSKDSVSSSGSPQSGGPTGQEVASVVSSGSIISAMSNELNGFAAQTSSMFSGLFGKILILRHHYFPNFITHFNVPFVAFLRG